MANRFKLKFHNVTATDIINAAKVPNWLSIDLKAETQSDSMKKNGVRYLALTIKLANGSYVPLYRERGPEITKSKTKARNNEDDENKDQIPSAVAFQTRILASNDKELKQCAIEQSKEKFGDESKTDQILKLLKQQSIEWEADKLIDTEFKRLFNSDKSFQTAIKFTKKENIAVRGNIQYTRDYNAEQDKDNTELAPCDQVSLKEPIVHHRISVNKQNGEIYCKIFDKNTKKPKELTYKTITDWLTFGSVICGMQKYQVCIYKKGVSLHARFTELHVSPNTKRSEPQAQMRVENINALDEYNDIVNSDGMQSNETEL